MALTEILRDYAPSSDVLIVATSLLLGAITVYLCLQRPLGGNAPKLVKGDWPLIGSIGFFTRRWEFCRDAALHSATGNFSFHVGQHPVVGVSGESARKTLFDSRDFNFTEGYNTLFAGSPKPPKLKLEEDDVSSGNNFVRTLLQLLRRENFAKGLPGLISDTRKRLDDLAQDKGGITKPFDSIYAMVYQLTMRTVACNEIANDPVLLEKTLKLFEALEDATAPEVIIFPWLPSPAKLRRFWSGAQLYMIFKKIVGDRIKLGKREDDPLQLLMDRGDTIELVVSFVLGALFAGQLNSGINAAWVLTYLSDNPQWREKIRKEVETVAEKYDPSGSKPLAERLTSVPIDAWESEFPLIDLCLKDSIRLQALGTVFRRNTSGKPIKIGNEEVPSGAFAVYHLGDTHMNPETYPNPEQWDPNRYLPERAEDQKEKYAYLGWGAGRHPCLGMRFAKLEQNIILAFFIAYFDFELCHKDGRPGAQLPEVNFNALHASKPRSPVYIKYSPRV